MGEPEMTIEEVARLHNPWTMIRLLLNQGGDIQLDHVNKSYQEYAIRLDGAARERLELATAVFRNALSVPPAGATRGEPTEDAHETAAKAAIDEAIRGVLGFDCSRMSSRERDDLEEGAKADALEVYRERLRATQPPRER